MDNGQIYSAIFLYSVIILTIFTATNLSSKSFVVIKRGANNSSFALILCIVFSIWLGYRPPTYEFGDTGNYAYVFYMLKNGELGKELWTNDVLWNIFTASCARIISVSTYFTIIDIGYFGFTFLACKLLVRNNVLAAILFMFGALSFFSYATNGIRNGLACSIVLFVIALYSINKKYSILALALAVIALNIHKSTIIPLISLAMSAYFIRSFKWAYSFWILSIIISLIAGGFLTSFFAGLGFDDRLSYLTTETSNKFSRTGFRWDFLLYSMMPIILGYYIVIKRGINDKTYLLLLNTYTIANAIWVMVIRANYSNRLAYLSWFMYPLVLAYPLFNLDIWGDSQGKIAGRIMLANIGFTWLMITFF